MMKTINQRLADLRTEYKIGDPAGSNSGREGLTGFTTGFFTSYATINGKFRDCIPEFNSKYPVRFC